MVKVLMEQIKIAAGIVTYNSDTERLEENIKSIINQVETVIISDNASSNIGELEALADRYHIKLIRNNSNRGIACGLNQCIECARQEGYDWIITLDQDSICPANIIVASMKHLVIKEVAMVVPLIRESNSGEVCLLGEDINGKEWQEVRKCITSAAVTNIHAWEKVRGFDEYLFIDYVDYDFAMKVRLNHYKIIRMNNVILDHQIGDSKLKTIFHYKIRVANHPAFRKYYIARNMIIYMKRYGRYLDLAQETLRMIKVFLLIILYENNKTSKLRAYVCGVRDGIAYRNHGS